MQQKKNYTLKRNIIMENTERIELLNEAERLIAEAIGNITTALKGTSQETEANAYIIGHLNSWIGNGNPYDKSIDKYIAGLKDEEPNDHGLW